MCDCNNSLLGIVCLGPVGDSKFDGKPEQTGRLEVLDTKASVAASQPVSVADWPTYRKDNVRSAGTRVEVPAKAELLWRFAAKTGCLPTAPGTAGNMTFLSGTDGILRAFESQSRKPVWTAYTGGAVMFPPSVWEGRVYVGSGDGWVYCLAEHSGAFRWRFRAAPAERVIGTGHTPGNTDRRPCESQP
jgi:outer membrane protein assembly factor BamB